MSIKDFEDLDSPMARFDDNPSDHECRCKDRNPNDHTLTIEEGTPSVIHTVCDKPIDVDGYIEVWNTIEPIPVRVEFEDFGWTPSTPNGPAEYNGFQWTIEPRHSLREV